MDLNKNDTLTGICNSALAMIGETRFIADIQEDNSICKVLRQVLEQVCREVQAHEFAVWDELEVDEVLVMRRETEAGGVFNGRYQYNLPLHMISPIDCYYFSGTGSSSRVRYEIRGGYLHSDVCPPELRLRYIKFSFDPSEWGTELRACIIRLLAARCVAAIVKDYSAAIKLEQQFWSVDYVHWAANKKNKARRSNIAGNDGEMMGLYPPIVGGKMNDIY